MPFQIESLKEKKKQSSNNQVTSSIQETMKKNFNILKQIKQDASPKVVRANGEVVTPRLKKEKSLCKEQFDDLPFEIYNKEIKEIIEKQ